MPAILAYLALRLGLVLADPRKSVRRLIRTRPLHVWALWAVGVVVILGAWEFDAGVLVYLAGVMLLMAFQVGRSLRELRQVLQYAGRRSIVGMHRLGTSTEVGLRLCAVNLQDRVARG